ncbi:hypothetical protein SLS60_011746 [Paraconiothyrium brasiliense]|uniref:Probable beta-glucosidase G n=1 Tax=Paraconiothyrium brasiliense TaxID=300254 RepID=A0ABR3QIR6_9PLEO
MDATIRGHQDAGVQACAKHYIGNEQETHRSTTDLNDTELAAVSSNIDDRTLHEVYLWPFANAVKAGASSIMCSYNRLNGTYACEDNHALSNILKEELGFEGYVMSDWFATHSGYKSINAGLDMTMPGPLNEAVAREQASLASGSKVPSWFGGNITIALNNGTLNESRVDDMVRRIMTPYYQLNQDQDFPTVDPSSEFILYLYYGLPIRNAMIPPARNVKKNHAQLIREVAAAGTVLLKNDHNVLPVSKNVTNVAIFGNGAPDPTDGLYFFAADPNLAANQRQLGDVAGNFPIGGGSGSGRTTDLISPLRAIRDRGFKNGFRTQYITDNKLLSEASPSIFPLPDVCIVFLKTYATEAWDRLSFENDWNSTLVVENVSKLCPNSTVVVTHSAGVNTLPFIDSASAVVAAHYPGEQAGHSIVDVLWGDVNPSGHLPYTIPKKESDYDIPIVNITGPNATDADAWQADFTEGLLIDYRHFDAFNITPLYEFGYGLSYTTFGVSPNITFSPAVGNLAAFPIPAKKTSPGGNPDLWATILNVTVTVTNTGPVAGAAVPQLYISLPSGTGPKGSTVKVLRGFEKVKLSSGMSAPVTFPLMRRDVSFWNVEKQDWQIPSGDIGIRVGFSSRDIKAMTSVNLVQEQKAPLEEKCWPCLHKELFT